MRDYKWPSSKRHQAAAKSRVISQVIAVAVGLNAITYALSLLIPNGLWLALILLVLGCVTTTAVMKDIL